MALVRPISGVSSRCEVTDITAAELVDGCGTKTAVDPLGATRKKGLDHDELGMCSMGHSAWYLLILTIISLGTALGSGEYITGLAFRHSLLGTLETLFKFFIESSCMVKSNWFTD